MAIEVRIMTGARAGKVSHFDKPHITLGRQQDVDVQFDPRADIDVSGRHAEIRVESGKLVLTDLGSTNGTFVNGEKIEGPREIRSGDRVQFGSSGPDIEVRFHRGRANTEERIAIAVKKQTAGLRNIMIGAAVVLAAGLGGAYFMMQRAGQQRIEELNKIQPNDSPLGRTARMDQSAIHQRNAPAVAVLVSEIRGVSFAGTGFGITSDGLVMTNRHNVVTDSDTAARIVVKFVDTREWIPARVVKISANPDEDLALLQLEGDGPWPAVAGISPGEDVTEGASVVTIGFPLGYETPQEGEGNDFLAKSTLSAGTVSKRTSTVLQIDSYAAHGSSGSPVFDALGHVVGVIFGGQPEANGRIVFAVPPDRVAAFARPENP